MTSPDLPAADAEHPAPPDTARTKPSGVARVAKVMARAGLCSRRDAEAWIADGRVAVNGTVIASPALDVGPDDEVMVDGYPIEKPERTRLFTFHKTRGLVTTARDPEGRPTIFDALPRELPRLVTIGRLDINTEGLLLLTNDGGLARLLELPSTGWIRRYRVRANGAIDQARLDALAKGLTVDGVTYAGIAAKLDRVQGANVWLTMGLKEGKNREIKRVLEHLGLAVTRLIRISYGPFQLGELAEGAVEEVRTRVLRDQLGTALAAKAGVDFEGPLGSGEAEPVPAARDTAKRSPVKAGRNKGNAAAAGEEGERRKIKRTQTADRRGRAVAVERITGGSGEAQRPRRSRTAPAGEGDRTQARPAPSRSRSPAFAGAGRAAPPRAVAQRNEASGRTEERERPSRGRMRPASDSGPDRRERSEAPQRRSTQRPNRAEDAAPRREGREGHSQARTRSDDRRSGAQATRSERPPVPHGKRPSGPGGGARPGGGGRPRSPSPGAGGGKRRPPRG